MATINKFTLVQVVASSSGKPTVQAWAPAAFENPSLATSPKVIGVSMTDSISSQAVAVMKTGYLRDVSMQNSETWVVGDLLWGKSDGSITKTRPVAPLPAIFVGVVFDVTASLCIIDVNVRVLPAITELSGVLIDAPVDKDVLIYNGTSHYYETRQATEADLSFSDITTNNVTTARHGLIVKAPNDISQVFRGDATWGQARTAVVTKTGNYTATTSDRLILCNAVSAAFTITLPAASGNSGLTYFIKKTDSSANNVIIDANASELIDGALTIALLKQYEAYELICDGTGWNIV